MDEKKREEVMVVGKNNRRGRKNCGPLVIIIKYSPVPSVVTKGACCGNGLLVRCAFVAESRSLGVESAAAHWLRRKLERRGSL